MIIEFVRIKCKNREFILNNMEASKHIKCKNLILFNPTENIKMHEFSLFMQKTNKRIENTENYKF